VHCIGNLAKNQIYRLGLSRYTNMTWKTVSCKIDEEDFATITSCIETGEPASVSEFIREVIKDFIENRVITFTTDEDTSKPIVKDSVS